MGPSSCVKQDRLAVCGVTAEANLFRVVARSALPSSPHASGLEEYNRQLYLRTLPGFR